MDQTSGRETQIPLKMFLFINISNAQWRNLRILSGHVFILKVKCFHCEIFIQLSLSLWNIKVQKKFLEIARRKFCWLKFYIFWQMTKKIKCKSKMNCLYLNKISSVQNILAGFTRFFDQTVLFISHTLHFITVKNSKM